MIKTLQEVRVREILEEFGSDSMVGEIIKLSEDTGADPLKLASHFKAMSIEGSKLYREINTPQDSSIFIK